MCRSTWSLFSSEWISGLVVNAFSIVGHFIHRQGLRFFESFEMYQWKLMGCANLSSKSVHCALWFIGMGTLNCWLRNYCSQQARVWKLSFVIRIFHVGVVLFSFFRCDFRPTQNPILACCVNKVGIWIDPTQVLVASMGKFGSFIKLVTQWWNLFSFSHYEDVSIND